MFLKRKNVIFANVADSSMELIKKSSIVATVTGTVGWEAIRLLKPVITFGNAYYNFLPGVFFWNNSINIKKISKTKVNEKILLDKIHTLSKKMGFGLDSVDYSSAEDLTSDFKNIAYNESREMNILINSLEAILKK